MRERLLHSLLPELRKRDIPPSCLEGLTCEDQLTCLIELLKKCKNAKVVQVGIDPGATVGIVVAVDLDIVWSWEGSSEEALSVLKELIPHVKPDRIITSEKGIELVKGIGNVIVIDEHGTSKKRVKGLGRHASSAFLMIAKNSISRRVDGRRGARGGLRRC